jgi:hypothetical protein
MVLTAAALCYMALGAVLRILPRHVGHDLGGSAAAVGFAVGAPALTAIATRPLGHGHRLLWSRPSLPSGPSSPTATTITSR